MAGLSFEQIKETVTWRTRNINYNYRNHLITDHAALNLYAKLVDFLLNELEDADLTKIGKYETIVPEDMATTYELERRDSED